MDWDPGAHPRGRAIFRRLCFRALFTMRSDALNDIPFRLFRLFAKFQTLIMSLCRTVFIVNEYILSPLRGLNNKSASEISYRRTLGDKVLHFHRWSSSFGARTENILSDPLPKLRCRCVRKKML